MFFLALCMIEAASIMISLISLTGAYHGKSLLEKPSMIWLYIAAINGFANLFITVYLGDKICVWWDENNVQN